MLDEARCLSRANLQQLREFLLHGVELNELETGNFDERIKRAQKQFTDFMAEKLPQNVNDGNINDISVQMQEYILKIKEIYFEMGLQCGANLSRQLLTEALSAETDTP